MANAYGVYFSAKTKFVRKTTSQQTAPIRLVEKTYRNKDGVEKSYYQGGVQLANGQWIWVTVGGTLDNGHETRNGIAYLPCKVSLTKNDSGSGSNKNAW